jgi:AraC-like DNA-binding protein
VGHSVLSVSSRALLDACTRLGLDTAQILAAARVDAATIADPDARIPIEQAEALWRTAYDVSNDPNLALHAIEVLPFGAYRVIDFLASSAPTVGAALAKVADYFPLVNDADRLSYVVGADVTYALEARSRARTIARPYAEYTLAAVFLRTRVATNPLYRLLRVEFSHPRPADISEHERVFDCPVVFGCERCRLVMTPAAWNTERAGADPALFALLDSHARNLLDHLPRVGDFAGRVRDAIDRELRGGDPRLDSIAKQLAMSARTLQRRLRSEGLVFNDVLDEMRFRAAQAYLAHGDVACAEVAFLLGFAEQSSFNRAFKRWSGRTPTEFRLSSNAKPLSSMVKSAYS